MSLRGDDFDLQTNGATVQPGTSIRIVGSIALTIAVAEMGDKTQIATAALAARSNPLGTWLGATAGEVAAGMLGAVAGQRIGSRIPPQALRVASALLFFVFGIALLVSVW